MQPKIVATIHPMRALTVLVVLALVASIAWMLRATDQPSPQPADSFVERDDARSSGSGPAESTEPEVPGRSRVIETAPQAPAAATSRTRAEATTEWEILGRLVTVLDGAPLHGYTVCVQPSGARARGPLPVDHLTETDAAGSFRFDGLDRTGPWDVFAYALDLPDAPRSLSRVARIGAARAGRAGEAQVQTFKIQAGPLVVLRSPLPPEIEVADVLLEARGRVSRLSSQIGRLGGYARAFTTPEGFCAGRIPNTPNSVQNEGFGVRAVTADGLWSIAERKDGRLLNNTEATIDVSLQPRGKIVLRLEGVDPDVDLTAARRYVGFRLPLGDPERDELDLPKSMQTTEQSRALLARDDGLYEIHDLPIGPVEIVTRAYVSGPRSQAAFEVNLAVQAQAVHGEPDPVTVRLRRRR